MSERKNVTAKRLKRIGSDMARVDAYANTKRDYDDIPELTNADFKRGTWHIGGVPIPRGRPKSAAPKNAVSLRLDPDVIAHFRRGGRGWQSRINAALRKVAKLPTTTKKRKALRR